MKDGPYLEHVPHNQHFQMDQHPLQQYVDSVPPQRERACLDFLRIYETVQYSVTHLAASTVSLLQVHKDVWALQG